MAGVLVSLIFLCKLSVMLVRVRCMLVKVELSVLMKGVVGCEMSCIVKLNCRSGGIF